MLCSLTSPDLLKHSYEGAWRLAMLWNYYYYYHLIALVKTYIVEHFHFIALLVLAQYEDFKTQDKYIYSCQIVDCKKFAHTIIIPDLFKVVYYTIAYGIIRKSLHIGSMTCRASRHHMYLVQHCEDATKIHCLVFTLKSFALIEANKLHE